MDYRRLGSSGLKVSALGLGTNNFGNRIDEARVTSIINEALEVGVNYIDTADIYANGESETLIGKVLGARRAEVIIASKFGYPMGESPPTRGGSRRWIMSAVEGSLRRLRTEYLDIYELHGPDADTPVDETLCALDDLVRQGKVRYTAHTDFPAWELVNADWVARVGGYTRPIAAQHRYNLLDRAIDMEILPACRKLDIGIIPWYPLALGFLTGKYKVDSTPSGARLESDPDAESILTDSNFKKVDRLEQFALHRGHTLVELAIGWLLSQPEVGPVICGASTAEQVRLNSNSTGWRLTPEELASIDQITLHGRP